MTSYSIRNRNSTPSELRFATYEAAKAYVKSRQLHVEIVQSGEPANAHLDGDMLTVEPEVAKEPSIPQPPAQEAPPAVDPDAPAPGHRKTVAESRAEEKERVAEEKADAKAEAKAERESEREEKEAQHVRRAPHNR